MERITYEILMRRYLLGNLPQEERNRLEDRYLADADMHEELLATENDLVDSYIRQELTERERQQFETGYSTTAERREKVEFARALSKVSALERRSVQLQAVALRKRVWPVFLVQSTMPQWALAGGVIVIIVSGLWLMVENHRLKSSFQHALAEQAELRQQDAALRQRIANFEATSKSQVHESQRLSEIAKLETPMGPDVTLRLAPGLARGSGEEQRTLVIRPTTTRVRVQLMLDRDEYKTYEAALLDADEGKTILRGQALMSQSIGGNAGVVWTLPLHSIISGDYIVQLGHRVAQGSLEDIASYSFRVLRK
jgi:hypothetical protein